MKYYIYLLKDMGEVFYVGKGTRRRMYDHVRNALTTNKNVKCLNKIRKILSEGRTIVYEKVFFTDSATEAYEKEQEIIKSIGLDNLTNLTTGGEGVVGYKITEEHRRHLSISIKKAVEEGRLNLKKSRESRVMTEKYKKNLSDSLKKYWDNPELRKKQSECSKTNYKAHPAKKIRTYTEESIRKMSEAGRKGNELRWGKKPQA